MHGKLTVTAIHVHVDDSHIIIEGTTTVLYISAIVLLNFLKCYHRLHFQVHTAGLIQLYFILSDHRRNFFLGSRVLFKLSTTVKLVVAGGHIIMLVYDVLVIVAS